jgi:uncharacterized protein YndB with AHSA1/START domain
VTTERVERSIELDAPPADVWPSLVDPDELEGWLGDRVEVDMQPGGCGHVIGDDGVRRDLLVTEVEPARRLAWHWWAEDGELSSVEITLVPTGTGTRVDVVEIAAAGPAPLQARACAAAGRLPGIGAGIRLGVGG